MSCVVVATIKIVQENYGWFYPACRNCNKKVLTKTEYLQYAKIISDEVMNLSPTSLVCPKCDKECTSITIKFKVHLRVQDETGSISFVMFDKDVTKLIGSTASDIGERQVKANDTESFPHEISRLVEKNLAFKIEVSDYNLNHDYHVYTIQKLCDDPDILAELVAGNGNGLEVVDEVFSQEGSEIKVERLSESSQMAGAAISKDVVSVTADSSIVEAEKDSGTSPNGKRSLQDVEGQNIGELSSSSKNNRKRSSRVKT
ncbi:putative nucleic acid-binding, replication factor A [Helianthus annuus]|nr:putative nucleic acid-binding, replication factor A [Helianthus annuus]